MPTHPPARLLAASLLVLLPAVAPGDGTGEAIYAKQCAWCHGKTGEGSKRHKQALAGDLPVTQLADVIRKTMPENDPESLSADEAKAVAEYVHAAFYSKDARDRNKPPRVELSRLTVRQYENAVADLIGSFRAKAEYTLPDEGSKAEPVRYARNDWDGAIYAPATGEYELILTTPSDVRGRIWLNEFTRPLVDAWVRSGDQSEYRGRVKLLGGRAYRIKVEAVVIKKKPPKDKPNEKVTEKRPEVGLHWVPPGGVREPVPARYRLAAKVPEVYVNPTPFPPDDRSMGWERGNTVSKAWDAATTDAALEAAGYVSAKCDELAGTNPAAPDRAAKLKAFARTFAERAFRRPLTDDQRVVIDKQFASGSDPAVSVKRVTLYVLKSPRFLYREDGGPADGYTVASRLSFALWDSLPDQQLLAAAKAGKLSGREEVVKQAERMLSDPRAKQKLRGFLHHWLRLDHAGDLSKDTKRFPGFDAAAVADLRHSLDLFLDEVVWSEKSDFRELLLSDSVYLNDRLAKLYGAEGPENEGFEKAVLDPGKRAGVLTHPLVMAAFAYSSASSPIHRGVFLARGVLGLTLRPPMDAFSPLSEDLHPTLTTRERTILQTKPAACATCHDVINPLGFTLENFDAIGRFRDKDNGKPVDPTGGYVARDGASVTFNGPRELAEYLAGSPDVHGAFVEQLTHHLVQQPARAYGADVPRNLCEKFAATGYNIRKLAAEVAATAALSGTDRTASLK